jgi:hypothetical protein
LTTEILLDFPGFMSENLISVYHAGVFLSICGNTGDDLQGGSTFVVDIPRDVPDNMAGNLEGE